MRLFLGVLVVSAALVGSLQAEDTSYTFEHGADVQVNGVTWLRTVITPFDAARPELRYKVYTHLYDLEGILPITKGDGGKYPHHRGLFIGWRKTRIGKRTVDTWSGSPTDDGQFAIQQWKEWKALRADSGGAAQTGLIHWSIENEEPFMTELRSIKALSLGDRIRMVDFESILSALEEEVVLQGDPQHAGVHVRMAQEVADNESATEYVLPEQAKILEDDVVEGAWWVCASMPVRGKRYWVLHMTSPDLPTGVPLYSIRKYGRFGAFFEPEVEVAKPFGARFRIIWTDQPMDRARCEELYKAYADTRERAL